MLRIIFKYNSVRLISHKLRLKILFILFNENLFRIINTKYYLFLNSFDKQYKNYFNLDYDIVFLTFLVLSFSQSNIQNNENIIKLQTL